MAEEFSDAPTLPELSPVPMSPQSGTGREVVDYLRAKLHIPEGVRWFELRIAVDEPITVKMEFQPRELRRQGGRDAG